MRVDRNLEFLRSKIVQTGTALCSMEIPGVSDTAYIIHTNTVDDEGNISFNLIDSFPKNIRHNLDSFSIKLFYYKKGLGYFMNIQALASADSAGNMHAGIEQEGSHNLLSVKARIMAAEYSESYKVKSEGMLASIKKKITQVAAGFFMF